MDLSLPCSEQSLRAGEPIQGSATAGVDTWLLLEHRGVWGDDVESTDMPEGVREWLDQVTEEHARVRVQLIRRDADDDDDGDTRFYFVQTAPRRRIYKFQLARLDALEYLDVEALFDEGDVAAAAQGGSTVGALYLVCAHGRRDRCCARHGVALYNALKGMHLDGELWQSSHQGGHRFAATLLYLPWGIHYGRLGPDDAEGLATAHLQGRLFDLEHYRGDTRWSPEVQTAEAWLREQIDEMRFDSLDLVDDSRGEEGRHTARFRSLDGQIHRLTVEPRQGQLPCLASCEGAEPAVPRWFEVVRHEAFTTRTGRSSIPPRAW